MKENADYYVLFDEQSYNANDVIFLTPWKEREDLNGTYQVPLRETYTVLRVGDIIEMRQATERYRTEHDDDFKTGDFIYVNTKDGRAYLFENNELNSAFRALLNKQGK